MSLLHKQGDCHTIQDMKKKVYSGIRATNRLHIGNYLGAVKGMLALQDDYDCIFSVVDLHAITTPYDLKILQANVREIIIDYLAAGLNPKKCLLEIQSQVPEHTELAYLLSTVYPVSRLEDLPTYKDKKAQYPKYVNMGLLFYPVLMAADIMLYKGELVPVGIDQEPHIEVTREIVRKFNSMFGDTFPEPHRFATSGEYVPSLLGQGKMSKSVEGSYINLTDDLETIKQKIAKVPTDNGGGVGASINQFQNDPISIENVEKYNKSHTNSQLGVAALMEFVELFEGKEKREEYESKYLTTGLRYKELKEELAEAIFKELQPLQEKRKYFEEHPAEVDAIIAESREKCLARARTTMQEVKSKMGLS